MFHGYINQRTVNNKGQIQLKAITFYMADWGPNFRVPRERLCFIYYVKHFMCVCVNSYIVLLALSVQDYA